MMERIAQNIARQYQDRSGRSNRAAIFAHYRQIDDSHLWPILGNFNATDRAIRRLHRFERASGYYLLGLELCLYLDDQISEIVNNI